MADATPTKSRRRRRWSIGIGALVVVIVLGLLGARYALRAENLTAMLIGQTRSTLGAELALAGPGKFRLWPKLHLQLPKPRLTAPASANVLVGADAIEVTLPWHSLWSERVDIESIELVHPVLDLDAWSAWRAHLPTGGTTPDVRFALRIENGDVRSAGKVIASGVNAEFANSGDLNAWFERMRADASKALSLPPLRGTIEAKSVDIDATHIEGLRIDISDDTSTTSKRRGRDE